MVSSLQADCSGQLQSVAGALVVANAPPGPCPRCGAFMRVRKSFTHGGLTLTHGAFRVRETVHVCAAGCTRPALGAAQERPLLKRQAAVAQLLLPRSIVGYDLMCFIGLERFLHYRQRDEILAALKQNYHIVLSSGEVSALGRRFLLYLEALHRARAPELRAALEHDGGWPLHIDATGEDGQGTLFVPYAGWRGWALGAWKIPTERADALVPKLREVEALFGTPCALMRDLGKAMIEAAHEFVAGRQQQIPVLGCHMHFLKDIGKDLLKAAHEQLCELFRRFKVLPGLRALARDLGRSLGTDIQQARRELRDWLGDTDPQVPLPGGNAGLAAVRALGQWVLDYPDDGTDAGFPFDRPWLDLYLRCLRCCRAAESWLRKPCADRRLLGGLERLHRIVEPVRSDPAFQLPVGTLQQRAGLFDELRDALRLQPKAGQPDSSADTQQQWAELRDIRKAVEELQSSLRQRRPQRGPAQNLREAIDLILAHLKRHGPSLWGHLIALPPTTGGGIRLVARTNVLLESFFHEIKHGERRRSGRKLLSQDFEQLPASAVLARNLSKPDYVSILCGSFEELPHAFAQLDATDRSRSLPARILAAASAIPGGQQSDIVSSSLPRTDRNLVRSSAMRERVLAEARSRAPRRSATPLRARTTVV